MNFKKAFSIAETVILLTILAIGVAASTPIITRKIANITESGSTVGGGTHGRYEIFTKEIVKFGSDYYEKVIGGNSSNITVLERKENTVQGNNILLS